ncbi:pentapeptide repeat-containing protein [Lysobacter enzymogenes]|uniref:pentapeptide repeat-containing protein n=1 Tax=Lysobacter enzymogenes TaxID=69 RepID=UPI00384D6DA1
MRGGGPGVRRRGAGVRRVEDHAGGAHVFPFWLAVGGPGAPFAGAQADAPRPVRSRPRLSFCCDFPVRADLKRADLKGADLRGADLKGAVL